MKKKLLILPLIILSICTFAMIFIACNHTCEYSIKKVSEEHLKSEATCSSRAVYFFSCSCGNNGTKTFLNGGFKDHIFTYYNTNDNATCTENATETAICDNGCGAKHTREIPNSVIPHVFTNYTYNYNATFDKNGTESAPCDYGCNTTDERIKADTTIVKPVYETDDYIPIIAYSTPTNANWDGVANNFDGLTYEQYKYMKEAGFTGLQPMRDAYLVGGNVRDIVAWNTKAEQDTLKALSICEQLGLTYMVKDWSFYGMYNSLIYKLAIESGKTMEQILEYMFREDNACISHPNYQGHSLADEPNISQMTDLVPVVKKYKDLVPKGDPFFNLLPIYATNEQMGLSSGQTYKDYVEYYCKNIGTELGYVCYDFYPFGSSILDNYLLNFEIVAELSKQYNLDFRVYLQAGPLNAAGRSFYGPQDYRFQTYTALAYGVKYFIYFIYAEFKEEPNQGFIDPMGNRTERYYYVQEVNNEVHLLEDVMLSFNWDSVMVKNGTKDTGVNSQFAVLKNTRESHPRIKDYTVSRSTVTGCFKDDSGRDGFMFVNFSDPYKMNKDDITVNFNDTSLLLVYEKGVEKIVYGNTYTFTLDPGEGRFVIPLN